MTGCPRQHSDHSDHGDHDDTALPGLGDPDNATGVYGTPDPTQREIVTLRRSFGLPVPSTPGPFDVLDGPDDLDDTPDPAQAEPTHLDGESRVGLLALVNTFGVDLEETERPSASDRTGLPRPRAVPLRFSVDADEPEDLSTLPVPWINGAAGVESGDFHSFRADMLRALTERRCCVCGDPLNRVVTIAAAGGKRQTSAGWGHPVCVAMAVRLCPHFTRGAGPKFETVAWLYEGPGTGVSDPSFGDLDPVDQPAEALGRAELDALSKADPWGLGGEGR